MPVFSETSNPSSLSHCSFQKIKSHPATSSGSITIGESNCLGLLCPCPFDDLLKIDEQSTPGSEKIPSLPHHHDGENLSMIFMLKSVPFFPSRFLLLNDGMENGEWGLILKYQFPGRSRFTYRLSVSCVILLRFDLLQAPKYNRPVCGWIFSFEFLFGLLSCFSLLI